MILAIAGAGAVIVLALALASRGGPAEAAGGTPVLSASSAQTDMVSGSATIDITIDELPNGFSGMDIDVTLANPSIGQITAVQYNSDLSLTSAPTLPDSQVNLFAADIDLLIDSSDTNVILATLTVGALAKGTTSVDITLATLGIDDEDGNDISPMTIQSGSFTVNNIVPIVDAGIGASINEGDTFSDAGSFTDADNSSPDWTATVDYDDPPGAGQPLTLTGQTFNLSHTYGDEGSYNVSVSVDDGDGGVGVGNATVTVANVAPVLTIPANTTIDEGDTFSDSGSFTDPGNDTWTATVDYGEGAGPVALPLTGQTFSLSHTYGDEGATGVFTVTVTVDDGDGGSDTQNFDITVNNVAPGLSLPASAGISEGGTYTLSDSFTDPGSDTWTATVDYGEGAGVEALPLTGQSFTLSNLYELNGNYTISVTVDDGDGGVTADSIALAVQNDFPTLPGESNPAQDLDGDGLAEDVNGNGFVDFDDVVSLFQNMTSAEVQTNQDDFDFNQSGAFDFDDVVELFMSF